MQKDKVLVNVSTHRFIREDVSKFARGQGMSLSEFTRQAWNHYMKYITERKAAELKKKNTTGYFNNHGVTPNS